MKVRERRVLEGALRSHYRASDDERSSAPNTLVDIIAAEIARPARPPAAQIVFEQARRIGIRVWALHIAVALCAVPASLSGFGDSFAGAIGGALALATLIGLTRSRSCGMAELEASCPVNTQAVVCARAVSLCCADLLLIAITALFTDPSPSAALAQGIVPYLAALGAGLLAGRRAASPDATIAAGAAAGAVCAACIVLRATCPAAFVPAAELGWWAAAASALAFAGIETRAWARDAASAFTDVPECGAAL